MIRKHCHIVQRIYLFMLSVILHESEQIIFIHLHCNNVNFDNVTSFQKCFILEFLNIHLKCIFTRILYCKFLFFQILD